MWCAEVLQIVALAPLPGSLEWLLGPWLPVPSYFSDVIAVQERQLEALTAHGSFLLHHLDKWAITLNNSIY